MARIFLDNELIAENVKSEEEAEEVVEKEVKKRKVRQQKNWISPDVSRNKMRKNLSFSKKDKYLFEYCMMLEEKRMFSKEVKRCIKGSAAYHKWLRAVKAEKKRQEAEKRKAKQEAKLKEIYRKEEEAKQ